MCDLGIEKGVFSTIKRLNTQTHTSKTDIGTTSVKIVLVKNGRIAASSSMRYDGAGSKAGYALGLPEGHMEQDVGRIMVAIDHAFENLRHRSSRFLLETRSISITGQMHGVVCWDSTKPQIRSRLVTWEDKRCDRKFLQDIKSITGYDVHGKGIATLAWLQRHKSNEFCNTTKGYRHGLFRFNHCRLEFDQMPYGLYECSKLGLF